MRKISNYAIAEAIKKARTVDAAAELLGINRKTIDRRVEAGEIELRLFAIIHKHDTQNQPEVEEKVNA